MTEELQNTGLSSKGEKQIIADNASLAPVPGKYRVMRRNGKVTSFDLDKITVAMTKAFLSVEGSSAAASTRIHNEVELLASKVDGAIKRRFPEGGVIHIEDIQDQVELAIMRAGYQDVARSYVLYREERSQARSSNQIENVDDLPITKSVPKPLLPVIDKPIIEYAVREASNLGINEIALVISPNMNEVVNYFNYFVIFNDCNIIIICGAV